LHDSIIGERTGVPSVAIMTDKFISASGLMARLLGAGSYQYAVIEHPISSASAEGLTDRAEQAAVETVRLLGGTD